MSDIVRGIAGLCVRRQVLIDRRYRSGTVERLERVNRLHEEHMYMLCDLPELKRVLPRCYSPAVEAGDTVGILPGLFACRACLESLMRSSSSRTTCTRANESVSQAECADRAQASRGREARTCFILETDICQNCSKGFRCGDDCVKESNRTPSSGFLQHCDHSFFANSRYIFSH